MPWWLLQKTALSLVKSRLALGSSGWLVVCSVGCHHAQHGLIHRKVVVDYIIVITSIGDTPFQTRPDAEWAMIGQASLLHSWHWVLCSFGSLLLWAKAHKHKRSWRFLPVFILPNMFGLRLCLPNIRSCLLSSASKYKVPFQPAKSYLDRDLQNRSEFYQVIISIM